MALILEVVDVRTGDVRARVRLETLPFSIGRGYDNDLVLDDPYADAHHARVTVDDTGILRIEDLGSVNGLVPAGTTEPRPSLTLLHGTDLRVGRTLLRVRDPAQALPPALRYTAEPGWPAGGTRPWWSTAWSRLAAPLAAIAFGASYGLASYERTSGVDAVSFGLAFLLGAAMWAGTWAVASRATVHRFHFLEHLAVVSAVAMAVVVIAQASEWLEFLFPDNRIAGPIEGVIGLLLIAALIAGHLALASRLTRRQRWRAGAITSTVLVGLAALIMLAETETFSDIPEFSGVLKPVPVRVLPTRPIDTFTRVIEELRDEVDELAARE